MSKEEDQELGREGLAAMAEPAALPELWDDSDTPEGKVTYVVAHRSDPVGPAGAVWKDIARQHFPLKTQVKTVLLAVVESLGLRPTPADRFRVLDAEGARERRLKPKPREAPEYEVV